MNNDLRVGKTRHKNANKQKTEAPCTGSNLSNDTGKMTRPGVR